VPDSLRALAASGNSIHEFGKKSPADIKKMLEPELVEFANSIGIQASVDDLKKDTLTKVMSKLGYN